MDALEWIHVSLNLTGNSTAAPNVSQSVWDMVVHEYHQERLTVTNVQNLILVTLYVVTFVVATTANSIALVVFWRYA